MKSLILFLSAGLLHVACTGQDAGYPDSLLKVLKATSTEDSSRVTNLLNLSYAMIYEKPDSSMMLANEALRIAGKIKWQKGIALSLREKGLIFYFQSDFLNAIDYSQQALKEGAPLKHKLFDASVYNNIANVYADMGQREKAMDYYKKLLSAAQEMNHKTYEMNAWVNIGSIQLESGRYDEALESQQKGLAIAKSLQNNNIAAVIYNDIGTGFKKKGNNAEAMNQFRMSVQLAKENNNNSAIAAAMNNMAQLYMLAGTYDTARSYALQSLTYSTAINSLQLQSEAHELLSTVYEKQNKPQPALTAYRQFIVLRDSLLNDEKKQEITRKEMKFESEKKEAVLNAEHIAAIKQQKTVRNATVIAAGILLCGGLFSFVFYKRKRDAVTRQQEAELRAEIGDTEMKALRAQMNPHFIFNSLNSISDYIAKNNTKLADEYLVKFARLMRMILENSEQKEVPLAKDLKALELYMQLESLRMDNKFIYEIKVDDAIDKENTLVPPLILQPFVENSIWHGIAQKQGQGKIIVHIKKEGAMLNCSVEDNGIGRKEAALITGNTAEKKSLGMKITKERIDTLNKLKKTIASVQLSDLPQGTRVEVVLPLELSF